MNRGAQPLIGRNPFPLPNPSHQGRGTLESSVTVNLMPVGRSTLRPYVGIGAPMRTTLSFLPAMPRVAFTVSTSMGAWATTQP